MKFALVALLCICVLLISVDARRRGRRAVRPEAPRNVRVRASSPIARVAARIATAPFRAARAVRRRIGRALRMRRNRRRAAVRRRRNRRRAAVRRRRNRRRTAAARRRRNRRLRRARRLRKRGLRKHKRRQRKLRRKARRNRRLRRRKNRKLRRRRNRKLRRNRRKLRKNRRNKRRNRRVKRRRNRRGKRRNRRNRRRRGCYRRCRRRGGRRRCRRSCTRRPKKPTTALPPPPRNTCGCASGDTACESRCNTIAQEVNLKVKISKRCRRTSPGRWRRTLGRNPCGCAKGRKGRSCRRQCSSVIRKSMPRRCGSKRRDCSRLRRRRRTCKNAACRRKWNRLLSRRCGKNATLSSTWSKNRTCRRLQRSWLRCRKGNCRSRVRYYMRLHRQCAPVRIRRRRRVSTVVKPTVVIAAAPRHCARYRARLSKCGTNTVCRRNIRRALKARKCRLPQTSCQRRVRLVRRSLRNYQRKALRCGEVDESCVQRTYKRIAFLRTRLAKVRRQCNIRKSSAKIIPCANWERWVRRQRRHRARLQAQVAQCGDEDNKCVSVLLARVLRLNNLMRSTMKRCKVTQVPQHTQVSCAAPLSPLKWVHSTVWKKQVMCDDMKREWNRWMTFVNERRRRLHCESANCNSLDQSCLRMSYMQIVHLSHKVAVARDEFTRHLERCDRCGTIKLRFLRWLRRQRAERQRLHLEVCRCRPDNIMCHAVRVLAIRKIQREIKRRRYVVSHLHDSCSGKTTTTLNGAQWDQYTSPTTTTPWWTVSPVETIAPVRSVFGNAAISITSGMGMIVAIVALVVVLF